MSHAHRIMSGLLLLALVGCVPGGNPPADVAAWKRSAESERWTPQQVITHLKDGGMHFESVRINDGWFLFRFQDERSVNMIWHLHRNDAQDMESRFLKGQKHKDAPEMNVPPRKPDEVFRWGRYVFHGDPAHLKQVRSILAP